MSTTITPAAVIAALKSRVTGEVLTEGDIIKEVSSDFGRMITRIPAIVVRPLSAADVQATIQLAREAGIAVSTRSAGHTQSGQASNEGGILLDMRSLNAIVEINATNHSATVQGGVVWKDLVDETLKQKLVPRVLTNNLNVTVGGTLSVAGLGIASFKYGAQVDNIIELEVVTGAGDLVTCSPTVNSELFDVVRSGLGQCGVITQATIKLRACKAFTRTIVLLYDNLETFMEDVQVVFNEHRVDYLESWCVPAPMGFRGSGETREAFAYWLYPMHATIEFDGPEDAPDAAKLKDGLRFYKDIHQQDLTTLEFSNRLERLFVIWRNMGYWDNPHPWMETVLPWENASEFITTVLSQTPPQSMGGGHILLWPCTNTVSNAPLFMRPPDSPFTMGWGLLPGVPQRFMELAIPRLDMASQMSQLVGGKRYLSGYITFSTPEEWEQHFGIEKWTWFKAMKAKYDPDRLLNRWFVSWD